jgi:hypothetical protein
MDSYKKAACSGSILSDDLMNGNVTDNGASYFMGLNQVPVMLEQLRTNISNIDGNLTQIYDTTPTTTMNQGISQSKTA